MNLINWHKLPTFNNKDGKKGVGNPGKTLLSDDNDSSLPMYALNKKPTVTTRVEIYDKGKRFVFEEQSRPKFPRKIKKDLK